MLQWYSADLHIHTVLSACAELNMGPRDIVQSALKMNLDFIAVTDHNSAENVQAVMEAARGTPLTVIPGMEVASCEDIHIICLFPDLQRVLSFQNFIYHSLRSGYYDENLYGPQIICDKDENILCRNEKLLAFSSESSLDRIVEEALKYGAIVYPAHVDRMAYSIIREIGHIPMELPFNAVEISRRITLEDARKRYPELRKYTVITASDAHDVQDIGSAISYFKLQEPSFAELELAIKGLQERETSIIRPYGYAPDSEFIRI